MGGDGKVKRRRALEHSGCPAAKPHIGLRVFFGMSGSSPC